MAEPVTFASLIRKMRKGGYFNRSTSREVAALADELELLEQRVRELPRYGFTFEQVFTKRPNGGYVRWDDLTALLGGQ